MAEPQTEVTVAGHICLDMIPDIRPHQGGLQQLLVPGKLIDVGAAVTSTGGAVSNTGLALHRLGFRTKLMGKIGGDLFGQAILALLRRYGDSLAAGMIVSAGEHSSYTVVVSPPGVDRMFLHYTGTNDTFTADDITDDALNGSRLFHFGYPPLMRAMYEAQGDQLELLFRNAKRAGLTTSLDLAKPDPGSAAGKADWPRILARTLPFVDFALPSLDETWYMLDRAGYDAQLQRHGGRQAAATAAPAEVARLAARLLACGAAGVVLKLGERGLYLRTTEDASRWAGSGACRPADAEGWRGRELWAPCFQADEAGTTGAGDCTIAGFLGAVLRGMTPEQAVTAATAVGACSVERPDAVSGVPCWETVWERVRAGWPRRGIDLAAHGWTVSPGADNGLWIGPNDRTLRRN